MEHFPLLVLVTTLLLFAASAPASCSSGWSDGDDSVDRPNGDLPGMPITLGDKDLPSSCAKLCAERGAPNCVAWAYVKPNCSGSGPSPLCYLKQTVTSQVLNQCRVSGLMNINLLPPKFRPLPVGSVQPTGWLGAQLRLQADGLSGHLPLFWGDVMDSVWVGGSADVGLHERTPYWLNGFVPLAYQLGDPKLISKVQEYVSYILEHQAQDGWLGPEDISDGNAYWSKYPLLMSLRQYYEANSSDTRVLPAMLKFLKAAQTKLFTVPLGNSWSGARWQDLVLTIHWLLDYHADEQFLWDLAETLHDTGFDWKKWFTNASFPKVPVTDPATLYTHGVNNGQAIKSEGVWYRQSHNSTDVDSCYKRMQLLDQYHGQASGVFACDEHLAGTMPSRGTELCTVVETMYSYEMLFSVIGDPKFAERAEKVCYNALPATITPDMWAHQYLQQSNGVNSMVSDDHVWTHDGPDSTLFGLAPNYGCCTANFNQGWPKFVQHVLMTSSASAPDLVVSMYAPVSMAGPLSFPSGAKVSSFEMATEYPFGEEVVISAVCEGVGGRGVGLQLRIPSWAVGATVQVNSSTPQSTVPGTFHAVQCQYSTVVKLNFPMSVRVERRYNNSISVFRGPLLYGLTLDEEVTVLRRYAFQSVDMSIMPGVDWNFALVLQDDTHPEKDLSFESYSDRGSLPPYSLNGARGKIVAKARYLPSWQLAHNAAAPPPLSPVNTTQPLVTLSLYPFGLTDIRVAEFPTVLQ